MDELEPIKDTTVNGTKFQLCRLSAVDGSFLLMALMGHLQKAISANPIQDAQQPPPETNDEQSASTLIQFMLMNLDEQTFRAVQRKALSVVCRYEKVGDTLMPVPILMVNGMFSYPQLNKDISTVLTLTSQSLFANLSPFLSKSMLLFLMAGAATNQSNSLP